MVPVSRREPIRQLEGKGADTEARSLLWSVGSQHAAAPPISYRP